MNVSQDTKYSFYLIPVFDNSHIGHMAKLSLQTKQAGIDIHYLLTNTLK